MLFLSPSLHVHITTSLDLRCFVCPMPLPQLWVRGTTTASPTPPLDHQKRRFDPEAASLPGPSLPVSVFLALCLYVSSLTGLRAGPGLLLSKAPAISPQTPLSALATELAPRSVVHGHQGSHHVLRSTCCCWPTGSKKALLWLQVRACGPSISGLWELSSHSDRVCPCQPAITPTTHTGSSQNVCI